MSSQNQGVEQTHDEDVLRALLRRAQQGDREAFWTLVEPFLARLYRTCLAMRRNQSDAEDLAQDALLVGWRKVSTLREPAAAGGWLATIALRIALRDGRRRRLTTVSIDDVPEPPAALGPLGFVEWLAGLPPEQRALLILHYYHHQPLAEVARLLQLPSGTVRSRLHYLLRRLRKETLG